MELVSLISIISTTISGIGPASHYNEKNQFLSTLNPALICEKPINKDIGDECLKLLSAFEDGTFEYSPASLRFYGKRKANELFLADNYASEKLLEYTLEFDYTYISTIDIGVFELKLTNKNETVASDIVTAFPFLNASEQLDVGFYVNGFEFVKSDFIEKELIKPESEKILSDFAFNFGIYSVLSTDIPTLSTVLPKDSCEIANTKSGIVYPLIEMAYAFASKDDIVGIAKQHVTIPSITKDPNGWITKNIIFNFKMLTMKSNFDNNIKLPNPPPDYINMQSSFSKWRYGIETMDKNGCGPIAVYNLLFNPVKKENIHFASLVALFEALNADFLFGVFGTNIVSDEFLSDFKIFLEKCRAFALSQVNSLFHDYYQYVKHSQANAFVKCIAFLFGGITHIVSYICFSETIKKLFQSFDALRDYYREFMHDINSVVNLYTKNTSCQKRIFDFDGFKEDFKDNSFSILVFWNTISNDGKVNYFDGAHFACVKRTGNSIPLVFYVYNNGDTMTTADVEEHIYGYTNPRPLERTIASYVFKTS